ncbi:tetratricopeptide (TPR) repeat protein [Nocardiopsis mwathae]|uniref:Tetratricopeptide (TPR) repeat protein n=1 Tax=Nocardiopsis mwathae TaxID=1472723 RepID=A0A7X0D5Z8_9ACTN|nr:CHAT domain-containing protein [Nocardiopsis mwathae]MBB6172730.1 tetratricopeptide (TPR) repeat protein [Nocardiopsis mwathae]
MADPQHVDVHLPVMLVARDPRRARTRAERMLADSPEPVTRAVALRILGVAQREFGDTAGAHRTLRMAAAVATRAGADEHAAHARTSRLGLLALRGGGGVAGAALDRMAASTPSTRAPALLHQGVAAAQRGHFGPALAFFDAALAELGRGAYDRMLPGVLSNRGLALMYSGRLEESAEDLHRALALAERHALDYLRGITLQNLGCLATRRGDISAAVASFRSAARLVPEHRGAGLRLDHTDALLAAGMFGEARKVLLGTAVESAYADEITARLLRAKIHLGREERRAARDQALRVRARCAPGSLWARLADQVAWSALHLPGTAPAPGRGAVPRSRPAAAPPAGPPGRTAAGGAAPALARCVSSAPLGPLSPEVLAPRHADALRAIAAGDHVGARRELLRAADDGPQEAPAVHHLELLAHQHAHEREVAAAGARGALDQGNAAAALDWVEHGRALFSVPGRCRDRAWKGVLDRCREAFARARSGDDGAAIELRRLTAVLGPAQWHTGCAAAGAGGPAPWPGSTDLAGLLGRRVLVCYAQPHGVPAAITVVDGHVAAHPLPPLRVIEDAVCRMNGVARMNSRGDAADGAGLAAAAAQVERLLLAPLAGVPDDRPLVIAPAPFAEALPWGLLPALRGREVSVVPSGRAWLACRARSRAVAHRAPRALLAAGGDLGTAVAEVRSLHRRHPGAEVLTGPDARVGAVLDGLARCDLAHIVAHGLVPAGAPMLSGLALADGPLFAYDLESLPEVPAVTVLSSCRVGTAAPSPAGVRLGFAAALLALGGATVVAGVLPVRDRGTPAAMERFHSALASGSAPARAVADHLADAGFLCFGAG